MAEFNFDDSRWPLLMLRFPARYTHQEFLKHVEKMRSYIQRGVRFAILNDARGAQTPNALQRKIIADSLREEHIDDSRIAGVAVLVSSPTIAAVLTAISWISGSPYPRRNFHDEREAELWLHERLGASPPTVVGKRAETGSSNGR